MSSISDTIFVVIDVETTGPKVGSNSIFDIACVVVKDYEIVDEFKTLVNPMQFIPPFISNMTGVTNEMVFDAPTLEEVMPQIYEYLKNPDVVFVAHNARFDWNFVSQSIKNNINKTIKNRLLCTYKLSKKLIPNIVKKNVGNLAEFFNVPIHNRHRAYDDAFATAHILIELQKMLYDYYEVSELEQLLDFQEKYAFVKNIKTEISLFEGIIDKMPTQPGVFLMLNGNSEILYISESYSLKNKIHIFLEQNTSTSPKIANLLSRTHKIEWIETTTEIDALYKAAEIIQKTSPEFNKFFIQKHFNFGQTSLFISETKTKFSKEIEAIRNNENFIFIMPSPDDNQTIDFYLIANYTYSEIVTIGKKAPYGNLLKNIYSLYFTKEKTKQTNNILKDLTSYWIIKNKNVGEILSIGNENFEDIQTSIKNIISKFS